MVKANRLRDHACYGQGIFHATWDNPFDNFHAPDDKQQRFSPLYQCNSDTSVYSPLVSYFDRSRTHMTTAVTAQASHSTQVDVARGARLFLLPDIFLG